MLHAERFGKCRERTRPSADASSWLISARSRKNGSKPKGWLFASSLPEKRVYHTPLVAVG